MTSTHLNILLERIVSLAWSSRYCLRAMFTAANLFSRTLPLLARKPTWYTSALHCHWQHTKYVANNKLNTDHAAMMGHASNLQNLGQSVWLNSIGNENAWKTKSICIDRHIVKVIGSHQHFGAGCQLPLAKSKRYFQCNISIKVLNLNTVF